ncbi:hypothetical protein N9Y17_02440 [Gammaproteobacteria bacterium]|nr:hypothetical protein [Gammaproteobacteria bacterium]
MGHTLLKRPSIQKPNIQGLDSISPLNFKWKVKHRLVQILCSTNQSNASIKRDNSDLSDIKNRYNEFLAQICGDENKLANNNSEFVVVNTKDQAHLDFLLDTIAANIDDQTLIDQLKDDQECKPIIKILESEGDSQENSWSLPEISDNSPAKKTLSEHLKQKIITSSRQTQQQMIIDSVADTLLNSSNSKSVRDLLVYSLASIQKGNFQIRTNKDGELSEPPEGIPAVSYLFCGSRVMGTFKDIEESNFQSAISNYKKAEKPKDQIPSGATTTYTYIRPSTHDYNVRGNGDIAEGKGFLLGALAAVNNFSDKPENFGHDLIIGRPKINEVGVLPQSGNSGTCLLYQKQGDHKHFMLGFEQLGTEAHHPDKFGQQHSLVGASDKFTAANGLYGDDPTMIMKYIDLPIRAKYNGMHVEINNDNQQSIEKRAQEFFDIIDSKESELEKKQQLIKILQAEPSSAKEISKDKKSEAFNQNFAGLNFIKIGSDIQKYGNVPDDLKSSVKKILIQFSEVQKQMTTALPNQAIKAVQTQINTLHDDYLVYKHFNQYPHLAQMIKNFDHMAKMCDTYLKKNSKLLKNLKKELIEELTDFTNFVKSSDEDNGALIKKTNHVHDEALKLLTQITDSNPLTFDQLIDKRNQFDLLKDKFYHCLYEQWIEVPQSYNKDKNDDKAKLKQSFQIAKNQNKYGDILKDLDLKQSLYPGDVVDSDLENLAASVFVFKQPQTTVNQQEVDIAPNQSLQKSIIISSDEQTFSVNNALVNLSEVDKENLQIDLLKNAKNPGNLIEKIEFSKLEQETAKKYFQALMSNQDLIKDQATLDSLFKKIIDNNNFNQEEIKFAKNKYRQAKKRYHSETHAKFILSSVSAGMTAVVQIQNLVAPAIIFGLLGAFVLITQLMCFLLEYFYPANEKVQYAELVLQIALTMLAVYYLPALLPLLGLTVSISNVQLYWLMLPVVLGGLTRVVCHMCTINKPLNEAFLAVEEKLNPKSSCKFGGEDAKYLALLAVSFPDSPIEGQNSSLN